MSNTAVNREVMIMYDLHQLLALFSYFKQLEHHFLSVGGGYSKTGVYSWRGDTSTTFGRDSDHRGTVTQPVSLAN